MVTSEYAIDYIKNKLLGLINSGKLKATCNPSKSTVSFYVNDIETINRPLLTLTLRLSDHHPSLQHYVDNSPSFPSAESNTNISIEFYKPMFNKDGKIVRNRFNANARVKDDTVVLPFTVTYFEYKPGLLDNADVETIYMSILQWIYNNETDGTFIDPFKGTPKEAKTTTKTANIKTDFTNYAAYRNSVRYKQNQQDGWGNTSQAEINWWKTKGIGDSIIRHGSIIENKQHINNTNMKQTIRLTESNLKQIVKESVDKILNEIGDSDRIHNYLGTISGYHDAKGNDEQSKRAYNLSNRIQKNRNNGQLYDPHSEESAAEYRRNSNAFVNGYDKGWDNGRYKMAEATADPKWWQKDGGFPDMEDDSYSKPKHQVKVSETQLRQIVKESIQRIMNEGWFGNFFKSQGQLDFERRRKEAQDAYNKQKAEDEKWHKKEIGQNTSVDNSDMNAYRIKYGTTAGYTPNWRERAQSENEKQRKAYQNGRSHY